MAMDATSGVQPANERPPTDASQKVLLDLSRLLQHKWYPVIVYELDRRGPMGFGELESAIEEISGKMLAAGLDELEEWGLVQRTVLTEKPVRVRYSLTEAGRGFTEVLIELRDWGEKHVDCPDHR